MVIMELPGQLLLAIERRGVEIYNDAVKASNSFGFIRVVLIYKSITFSFLLLNEEANSKHHLNACNPTLYVE